MNTALPPPVCFIHVPKTAGTSLAAVLSRQYEAEQISPSRLLFDLVRELDSHELDSHELDNTARNPYRLWHGHFGLGDVLDIVPSGTRFVTAVRHPVDRVVSLFHYWRSVDLEFYGGTPMSDPNYDGVMLAVTCRGLDEFLGTANPSVLREISDAQTRYLSGSLHDQGEVSADKALQEIADRDILVVRQDRFTRDTTAVVENLYRTGLPPGAIGFHNRQSYEFRLTTDQRARILALNPNDLELFRHCDDL